MLKRESGNRLILGIVEFQDMKKWITVLKNITITWKSF